MAAVLLLTPHLRAAWGDLGGIAGGATTTVGRAVVLTLVVTVLVSVVLRQGVAWSRAVPAARRRVGDVVVRVTSIVVPVAAGAVLGVVWLFLALPDGARVTGPGVVPFRAAPVLLAVLCLLGAHVHGGLRLAAHPSTSPATVVRARRRVAACLGLYAVTAALTAFAALGAFGGGARTAVVGALALLLGAVVALAALFDLDRDAVRTVPVRWAGGVAATLPVVATVAVAGPGMLALVTG